MTHYPGLKSRLSAAVLLALGSSAASAAGFALIEQSVSNMGTAYAGGAAHAVDTSTLFFNPAGMTRLEGTNASAGLQLILPRAEFKDKGATFSPALGGGPIGGGDGGDAGSLAAVPHTYITHQLNDKTWVGFAVNAPFGLTTEYDSDWVGRYHAVKSAIKTVNLNPSIAYKVNDQFSLSAGVSAQFLDAELTNAIDFASLNAALLGGALPLGAPGSADGMVEVTGDSWGFGFNLGVLFEPTDSTRIGMHFRSEVEHDVKGKADFSGAAQPMVAAAVGGTMFADTGVSADVTLPASFSLSVFHQVNRNLALMADYTWTGWSSIPELRFDFDSAQPDGVTTFNWKDTNRFAVGAEYKPDNTSWTYRFGLAFDETPVDEDHFRTPRLPDEDRVWLSIGAGFQLNKNTRLDIGYAHLFMDNPSLNKTATPGSEDFLRGSVAGTYEFSVDIIAAQLEMRF